MVLIEQIDKFIHNKFLHTPEHKGKSSDSEEKLDREIENLRKQKGDM